MDHFDMVEKLRLKTQVSYEDAKAALEATGWDLLDALLYLEREGKLRDEEKPSYTTRPEAAPRQEAQESYRGGFFQRLLELVIQLIKHLNVMELSVIRHGKELFSVTLFAFLLLLIFAFWFTVPLMVLGLFFGLRYRLSGSAGVDGVNRVMDRAADMVDSIKTGGDEG